MPFIKLSVQNNLPTNCIYNLANEHFIIIVAIYRRLLFVIHSLDKRLSCFHALFWKATVSEQKWLSEEKAHTRWSIKTSNSSTFHHIAPHNDMDCEVCKKPLYPQSNISFTLGPHLAHLWYGGPYFPNQSWIWESSAEDESGPQILLKVLQGLAGQRLMYFINIISSGKRWALQSSVKSCHCQVASLWDLS